MMPTDEKNRISLLATVSSSLTWISVELIGLVVHKP